ncbi:MAG TPA: hypothetical protein VL225_14175 [Vicinamibacterales bacterium]|nr:hypothetical protein [Vicinamibacterales bacterium]
MNPLIKRLLFAAAVGAWLASVGCGLAIVLAYENRPGAAAHAPVRWPAATALRAAADRPTLVFLAHPQCSCTRASLEELAQVLARVPRSPKTYVVFLKPTGLAADWEKTDLWRAAESLPNVALVRDDDGIEARRFGVETSGQTLLYDRGGRLVFSGGITGSRGHGGENAGETALISLLTRGSANGRTPNVYGCPLFANGAP